MRPTHHGETEMERKKERLQTNRQTDRQTDSMHEVESIKETTITISLATYTLIHSFVCVYPSIVVCSFVNASVIIMRREKEEGS